MISNRRHFEQLRQVDLDHAAEIRRLEDKALTAALVVQDQRLDILNHAHAEAQRVQNTYVTREIFDGGMGNVQALLGSINLKVEAADTRRRVYGAIGAAVLVVGGLIVGVVALFL